MNEPLVSVIVPVYNAEEYISECLDSILRQSYSPLEIVVVDDGSTDHSLSIIQRYAGEDQRIKVFSQSNSGPAKSRNFGLDHSSGDFIMFVDSDDVISLELVEILLSAVEGRNEIVMCKFSKSIDKLSTGDRTRIKKTGTFIESLRKMYSPGFASSGPVAKLYSSEIFKGLRFPDIAMYEDAAVSLQALSGAQKVEFIDYFGYYYRFNSESVTNSVISRKNFAIMEKNRVMLDFVKESHPEAYRLAEVICVNDNDYVMLECVKSKGQLAKQLFGEVFAQNRDIAEDLGARKLLYLNSKVLWFVFMFVNKIYNIEPVRNFFKRILGVKNNGQD
jgi:glycosyltransferase involved in cell wall biosynthesis